MKIFKNLKITLMLTTAFTSFANQNNNQTPPPPPIKLRTQIQNHINLLMENHRNIMIRENVEIMIDALNVIERLEIITDLHAVEIMTNALNGINTANPMPNNINWTRIFLNQIIIQIIRNPNFQINENQLENLIISTKDFFEYLLTLMRGTNNPEVYRENIQTYLEILLISIRETFSIETNEISTQEIVEFSILLIRNHHIIFNTNTIQMSFQTLNSIMTNSLGNFRISIVEDPNIRHRIFLINRIIQAIRANPNIGIQATIRIIISIFLTIQPRYVMPATSPTLK